MPHHVAQQHLALYDCIRSGAARTQATIEAALATIGATPTVLVLTHTDDGVWTLDDDLTIPANVILQIPPGVTVFRPNAKTLTIQGVVIAAAMGWETGTGVTVRNASALTEISGVLARNISIVTGNVAGNGLYVSAQQGAGAIKRVRLFTEQGNGGVGIQMSQNDGTNSLCWQITADTGGGLSFGNAAAQIIAQLLNTGLGLGPGFTPSPSFYLQLSGDFAAKPGAGGLWTVPSSAKVKTLSGTDYTDGMAKIRQLPPARHYRYNGRAGTPVSDDEEFGFVAEEVAEVAPELVRTFEAKLEETDATPTALPATNLGPMLYTILNALKELDQRLATLEEGARPQARPAAPSKAARPRRPKA